MPAAALYYLMLDHFTSRLAPDAQLPSQPIIVLSALAVAVPVALRRLRPLLALGVLTGMSVVVQVSATDFANRFVVFFPVAFVLYAVAATYRRKVALMALAGLLAVLTAEAVVSGSGRGTALFVGLVIFICWGFGSMMRQRRAYASGLQQQAASRAVAEERLRIARELHDVVAHSMSVIAVQAGFGQYVIDEQPAKAREALGAIQATSREALDEMRRMLSVLRQSDPGPGGAETGRPPALRLADLAAETSLPGRGSGRADDGTVPAAGGAAERPPAAPLRPAPGLADLDRLITRVGHAGVHVKLQVTGERGDVPAGVDLSAFRIIQEALTNVVKHAATPDCRVTVNYSEDELSIEIIDDGRGCPLPAGAGGAPAAAGGAVPSGHGLIGMRERVHLCGGQFSAGPLPEHGFRVAAALPLTREPA
jgi:signal transduction histidine kinase